jgi:outer membrane protein OmpA-like peptidoglycan-associated protein
VGAPAADGSEGPHESPPSYMAEQAQRRAPAPEPEEKPESSDRAFEELRHIIVSPEQEQIVEIRSRIENPERRVEDVSSVVAEAIQLRRQQGDAAALSEALAPTVEETLRESVRKHPHVLADALFPVMGPAIRKSITETLRSMLESFNEALEHSLSVRGVRWRIEALRTGKPFAEVVLMHSLLFRVEQVFLIHRETGLALAHVTASSVATQDPSLVAGMLSAIQQFVRDSFASADQESLDSLTVGGREVWIEDGPHAVIAAVIRGHAPADYRVALKQALEDLERNFGRALEDFHGDAGPFRATEERLETLLVAHYREKSDSARKPWMAIAVGAVLLGIALSWISYSAYQTHRWSEAVRSLGVQPGIVVTSFGKSGRQWYVRGFRDPLASDPATQLARYGLDASKADLEFAPFFSLDDPIVIRRAMNLLLPPSGVVLAEHTGTLAASGVAPSAWITRFYERAPLVGGVTSLDTTELRSREVSSLESTVLTFPVGQAELNPGQQGVITQTVDDLSALRRYAEDTHQTATVLIIGHTDSSGIESANRVLSNQRAAQITRILVHDGIPKDELIPRGVGTEQPLRTEQSEQAQALNRSVTFHVNLVSSMP